MNKNLFEIEFCVTCYIYNNYPNKLFLISFKNKGLDTYISIEIYVILFQFYFE